MVSSSFTRPGRAKIEGVELEYEVRGVGEAVLFIHGSIVADAFKLLLSQPALEGYRLVTYHRRGFAGSTHAVLPVSIPQQAADARALLDALGVQQAHVVGHSYGGMIALQMALDAPQRVHSLALLEPGSLLSARPVEGRAMLRPIVELYEKGDGVEALEAFGMAVVGPRFREAIDRVLPAGWFEQAIADVDTFFKVELPALWEWRFSSQDATRINQPVLSVLGDGSGAIDPWAPEEHELLQEWMPQTESFVLKGATHALQMMNPSGAAEGLAAFFARHPIVHSV
jgi:pimeloyl-ACP methyl ester carboxylesterase